jgi:hypothetical protein
MVSAMPLLRVPISSEVMEDRMGIKVDGDSAYRDEVSTILSSIETDPVGRVIVTSIKLSGRDLTIQPFGGNCDSVTTALNVLASAPKGIGGGPPIYTPDGQPRNGPWFMGHQDDLTTRGVDERFLTTQARAKGGGSDVSMKYSPNIWEGDNPCFGGKNAARPDEVLLHELVHVSRYMKGLANAIPTIDEDYGNDEEFLAIVTANVYMSSRGRTDLRADHSGHNALDLKLSTSTGFLSDKNNFNLMNIYRLTWMHEFLGISNVTTARFNPFRELTIRLRDFPVGDVSERILTEASMPPR